MKTLKAILLLVVFCLTVSGSSYDVKPEIDNTYKVNKDGVKISIDKTIKVNKPPMGKKEHNNYMKLLY